MISLSLSSRTIKTERPSFVMGIVNATKDSFYSKSRGGLELAKKLIDEGADILDLGAESTRPGSEYVSADFEVSRLVPLIQKIRSFSDIPISVDTRKAFVMKACFENGADIFNDISAFEDDEESAGFAGKNGIPVILMHKRGIPSDMQNNTSYKDVFLEVSSYLEKRAEIALKAGIPSEKIIVDPGIGFGKALEENVSLIKNLGKLCGGKYMIMMGLSRKSCIAQMLSQEKNILPEERLYGTLSANIISVMNGAKIIRVHDVKASVDTLSVMRYII